MRRTVAYLCPNVLNFDVVDFLIIVSVALKK